MRLERGASFSRLSLPHRVRRRDTRANCHELAALLRLECVQEEANPLHAEAAARRELLVQASPTLAISDLEGKRPKASDVLELLGQ